MQVFFIDDTRCVHNLPTYMYLLTLLISLHSHVCDVLLTTHTSGKVRVHIYIYIYIYSNISRV